MFTRRAIAHLSTMWAQLTRKIPADSDTTTEARDREIVMRLSKGNVRLQLGLYKTEEDIAQEKTAVLKLYDGRTQWTSENIRKTGTTSNSLMMTMRMRWYKVRLFRLSRKTMQINIKKLNQHATVPVYATPGSACFDLHASEYGEIGAFSAGVVKTGIAVAVPPGFVMLMYSRSGHGFKNGVRLVNSVGVIDSDYRGEICVGLRNDSAIRFDFKPGDRIAQAMIVAAPKVSLVETDDLDETSRGSGGFGSTGL